MDTAARFKSSFSNNKLHLIILPTEKCNLRCTYCYEKFDKGRMTAETISAVKNLIKARSSELDDLHIGWFGGEPLAAEKIIYEISDFCKSQPFQFSADITTNASLISDSNAFDLVDSGIKSFQITLDGFGKMHDKVRKHKDGRGSFEEVISGIESLLRLKRTDFEIDLRIHVRQENVSHLNENIVKFGNQNRFFDDDRVAVKFRAVERLSDFEDHQNTVLKHADSSHIISLLNNKLLENFAAQKRSVDRDNVLNEQYICYACKGNSLVIRSDGRISKCTVKLYDEKNIIGKLQADGSIDADNSKLGYWFRGWASQNKQLLTCPISQ